MRAAAAIAQDADWQIALEAALRETAQVVEESKGADLVFFFASGAFAGHFPEMVRRVREATGTSVLAGCSGGGVIGPGKEIEGPPALSLLVLSLPGARLYPMHLTQETLQSCREPADWHRVAGVDPDGSNGWLVFADPYRMDIEALVAGFSAAYPGTPLIGGLASGDPQGESTHVFLNNDVYDEGAAAVALGGDYAVRTVVSQGAEPIGESWTITDAERNVIKTIGQRPALEVLVETLKSLPPDEQRRAQRNLLIGLGMDEYRDEFRRGDFLIRNLIGADQNSGVLAISAYPRIGQTIQFQLRDARAADEELRHMLTDAQETLGTQPPVAAVLCSCNGRGRGLFGEPDHDARAISEQLGLSSVAGFFCNGEIGPVGGRNFLHGFTASIGLIIPTS